jgi:hypothetical protein
MTSPHQAVPPAIGSADVEGYPVELLIREDIKVTSAPVAAEILRGLGREVRLTTEDEVDLSPDRILLVRGSPLWYRRTLTRLLAVRPSLRPRVAVWFTEPLPMPSAAGLPSEPLTIRELAKIVLRDRRTNDHFSNAKYLRYLNSTDLAVGLGVASRASQSYLAEEGVPSEFTPLGYHPSYGRLLGLERDIDVVFLGAFGVRRRRHVVRHLKQQGLDVTLLGSQSPTKGFWGEARTELLNRTKILLNVPRLPGHFSDRILMAMSCGALVVSEPLYLPDPFEPGVHYVESSLDEMADTVRRCLADEELRRRITDTAHRFLTEELPLERTYARLMELAVRS